MDPRLPLLTLFLLFTLSHAATTRNLEVPELTQDDLDTLITDEGAKEFESCIKNPNTCSEPRYRIMSRLAPFILNSKGKCPDPAKYRQSRLVQKLKCDSTDEKNFKTVLDLVRTHHPQMYNRMFRSLL